MKKITKKIFLMVALLGFSSLFLSAENTDYNNVIPLPNKMEVKKGRA